MCLNCVLGPLGLELKPLMFAILRFLRWRLFSQKFYQKLRLNVIFFGWCFWFVWLVCWSVCCVTGGQWWVHLALLCRRVTWGDHLWFIPVRCLLAMRVASVTERSPTVKIGSRILFGCSSDFYELIMFLARCRFFVFVRLIPCVKGQFIQHFLWRATWQDHHRFISLRRHLSVRVPSATECQLSFELVQWSVVTEAQHVR